LEKHRSKESCAECHRRIAPLGLVLENFDAIGGWRTSYQTDRINRPIDATGTLPGGDSFSTFPEFRSQMATRQDQFARCLTETLLTYAIGRALKIGDRPDEHTIVDRMQHESLGVRDPVTLIIVSDTFRNNCMVVRNSSREWTYRITRVGRKTLIPEIMGHLTYSFRS
jgi:hypothetical protein